MYQLDNFFFFFLNNKSPAYMNDVSKTTSCPDANTRTSFLKVSQPSRKTNYKQKVLLYITPTIWNSPPNSLEKPEHPNICKYLNICKQKVKRNFLDRLENIYSYFWMMLLFSLVCYYCFYHYHHYIYDYYDCCHYLHRFYHFITVAVMVSVLLYIYIIQKYI